MALLFALIGSGSSLLTWWMFFDGEERVLVGLCALNAVVVVAGLYVLRRCVMRQMGLIRDGARAVHAGDLLHCIPIVSRDELAFVAEMFNEMSVTIAHLRLERDQAAAAVRESQFSYRILFENNPQAMWIYDVETLQFLAANNAAISLYGYSREEFLSMTIAQLHHSDEDSLRQMVAKRTAHGIFFGTARHTKKDGTEIDVDLASHNLTLGSRPARLVAAHDISEKKLLERQLLHAQKLEAVGQLAGGIAHDFNNLLMIVSGYSDLLLQETRGEDREKIQGIKNATIRGAVLTRQLLAFGRKQVLQPKVVDLNHIIRTGRDIWSRILGEDIVVETILDEELWPVRIDPVQFEQVLMNLYVNARDAMPGGGQLTVRTANVSTDASASTGPAGRPLVEVSVSDAGCGIDEATLPKIFEPFFTTKPAGKGTGLGLSTVHGIVAQSGGRASVKSKPGEGTTFGLYFPALPGAMPEIEVTPLDGITTASGSETILVVEDDHTVRSLCREALAKGGYSVLEASDGPEALRIAAQYQGQIDLLLTDVVIPGMDGWDLSDCIRHLRPGIKVLFMSGYAADVLAEHGVAEDIAVMRKPFPMNELSGRVREMLDVASNVA